MVRWLFLLLALVAIALGMGAAVGVVSAGPECDCPPCEPPEGEPAPPGFGECDPTELAALQREIDALRGKKDGVPLSWPAHIPGQYRSDSFQAIFAGAMDEIEASADLVGFDCSEPPCIAQLRLEEARGVNVARSEAWRMNFGTATREISTYVPCGDGTREHIQLVAPLWDWQHDPKTMSPRDYDELARAAGVKYWEGGQSEEEAIRDRRLRLRLDTIHENWRCTSAP